LNRTNEVTILYRNTCIKVANRLNTTYLDTWDAFKGHEPKDVLIDGLHLNKLGNAMLFEALLKLIRLIYPELCVEELLDIAPYWKLLV
jgi:lysophospholipase L1-like esterase